jgi:phosphoribosyl 1,2-cyclic phosphodiesterase
MSMKVKLWGIRGSLPAPLTPEQVKLQKITVIEKYLSARDKGAITPAEFVNNLPVHEAGGFGGHTSCIEVSSVKTRILIDGGSGIRCFGDHFMRESTVLGRAKIDIFMTHFHWDHLIGLPFFTPVFIPGNEIHFYAVQPDLEQNIRRIFSKPNFPVDYASLGAKIFFHSLRPREPYAIGDMQVTPYLLDHPDPCWGFRVECNGKVFSHTVDNECTRMSREQLGADLPLYQNVDLMTFDAQYSFLEAAERINWGHSSGPIGIDLALRENIKRILFIHHDPGATDAKIARIENETRDYYNSARLAFTAKGQNPPTLDWCFAQESMLLQV